MPKFLLIVILILTLLGHFFAVRMIEKEGNAYADMETQSLGTKTILDIKDKAGRYIPPVVNSMDNFVQSTFTSQIVYTSQF